MRIETDYILNEKIVPMAELAEWLQDGNGEQYVVQAIKKHLINPEQRKLLFDLNLSIEEILNGRFTGEQEKSVLKIFEDWNKKLGEKAFGF